MGEEVDILAVTSALGLESAADLLLWMPTQYRDNTPVRSKTIAQARVGENIVLRAVYVEHNARKCNGGTWLANIVFRSENDGTFQGSVFGNVWVWKTIESGTELVIRARVAEFNGAKKLENVQILPPSQCGKLVPVYPQRQGLSSDQIWTAVKTVFKQEADAAVAKIIAATQLTEAELAEKTGYPRLRTWLRQAHGPVSTEDMLRVPKATAALALASLSTHARAVQQRRPEPQSVMVVRNEDLHRLAGAFEYPLTADQRVAVRAIAEALRSPRAARSFLSADVGCGKSVAYMLPLLAAMRAKQRYTCAIMLPREILVTKTLDELAKLAPDIPLQRVEAGDIARPGHVLVGTSAIIGACKRANLTPTLVVVDEQQKFSRKQIDAITLPHTNLIEVSATPIPRSMGLLCSGGADLITISERPYTQHIRSSIVSSEGRAGLFQALRDLVAHGGQVAIVYPRIGQEDGSALDKGQLAHAEALWKKHFGDRVAVLHGRQSAEEQNVQLERMATKQASVLVATTLIELGITLPALRAMVVVAPEQLGLSQLHQLRGRVARHGGEGDFYLLPTAALNHEQEQRLQVICDCADGFEVAEAELRLRGVGDMTEGAERQAGIAHCVFPTVKIKAADLEKRRAA